MQQLQQPLVGLSGRCKLPLTLPQLMGLMQAAQQGGGLQAGLPAAASAAQAVGAPVAASRTPYSAGSAAVQGIGQAPGPRSPGCPELKRPAYRLPRRW